MKKLIFILSLFLIAISCECQVPGIGGYTTARSTGSVLPLSGLTMALLMDDNDATVVPDYYGTDGTGNSILKQQSSLTGSTYSYYFDGANDYGSIPIPFATPQELTFAVWVYFPSSNTTAVHSIIGDGKHSSSAMSFQIRCSYTNGASTVTLNAGVVKSYYTGTVAGLTINTDEWVRILFTIEVDGSNNATAKSYLNGSYSEVATASIASYTTLSWETVYGFKLASESTTYVSKWEGYMTNLYIWNRVLSPSEILSDYNTGSAWYPY